MGGTVLTPGVPQEESSYEDIRRITSPGGKGTSSYSNVRDERNKYLMEQAAKGELTINQAEELRSKGISVSLNANGTYTVTETTTTSATPATSSSETSPLPSSEKPRPAPSQRVRDLFMGTETKTVSADEASKATEMSLRDDRTYQMSFGKQEEKGVSYDPNATGKPKSKLTKAYEASPLFGFVEGFKYAFRKPGEVDFDKRNEQVSPEFGKQALAGTLIVSGAGMTTHAVPIKQGKVNVATETKVVQERTPGLVVTEAKIVGSAEKPRSFFGITLKPKKFSVAGVVREESKITDVSGRVSGQPLVKTTGSSKILIRDSTGKNVLYESESVGNEVGGIGQRKTFSSSSLIDKSGDGVGTKQIGFDSNVESYAGINKDGRIMGAGVSKQGSTAYLGEQTAEMSTKTSELVYYNKELGLESMTPRADVIKVTTPGRVKFFDVSSGSQSEIPASGAAFRVNVVNTLKSESPPSVSRFSVGSGSVRTVAREQAAGSSGKVLLSDNVGLGVVNVKQQVVSAVNAASPSSASFGGGGAIVSIGRINEQKEVSAPSVYAGGLAVEQEFSYPVTRPDVSSVSKPIIGSFGGSSVNTKSYVVPGVKARVRPIVESSSAGVVGVGVSSIPVVSQGRVAELKVSQVQSQAQATRQISAYRQVSISKFNFGVPFVSSPVSVTTPLVPSFVLFGKNIGVGGFNVDVRRRGRFETVAKNVPLSKAFKIGKSEVGGSAAASFRVVPLSEKANAELSMSFGKQISRGLYASTKEKGVIIEKPSYRIKSSGELQEITFKGIAASKNKRRKL